MTYTHNGYVCSKVSWNDSLLVTADGLLGKELS